LASNSPARDQKAVEAILLLRFVEIRLLKNNCILVIKSVGLRLVKYKIQDAAF
jgi:hypothetical protein